MASQEYWQGFRYVVADEFEFTHRSGKGAQDLVNSMLNYSYAILASEVLKSLHCQVLTPMQDFCMLICMAGQVLFLM